MSTQVNPPLTIGEGVEAFLEKNQAKESFEALCQLVRKHYPQARRLEAEMNEHGYEPNVWEVWVSVVLPESALGDQLRKESRSYSEEMTKTIPFEHRKLMGILETFEED